jgi:hypothetical protein
MEVAMEGLNLTRETEGHRTVVHVRGEIDIATAGLLEGVLDDIVRHAAALRIELDLFFACG